MFNLYIKDISWNIIAQSEIMRVDQVSKKLSDISTVKIQVEITDEICNIWNIARFQNVSLGMFKHYPQISSATERKPIEISKEWLVWDWKMNWNANDSSWNGNDGTVYSAMPSTDRLMRADNAYSFDGVSSYVTFDSSIFDIKTDVTYSFWLYVRSLNGVSMILSKYWWWPSWHMEITIGTGKRLAILFRGATNNSLYTNRVFSLKTWYDISVTYNILTWLVSIYVDWKFEQSNTQNIWMGLNISPLTIGARASNPSLYMFNGVIDYFTAYNRILSDSEILDLHRIAMWLMDNNTIVSWIDAPDVEETVFDWIITNIEAGINTVDILASDYLYLLKRRVLHADKSYTIGTSYTAVLEDILSHINTIYDTGIMLSSFTTDTLAVAKSFKTRDNVFSLLQDLAKEGYEFRMVWKTLEFWNYIGEDKTTGENAVEYIFDVSEPNTRNINAVKYSEKADDFANSIFPKTFISVEDTASIALVWKIEANGDDNVDPNKTLTEKLVVWDYEITGFSSDYFEAEIGDRVSVNINTDNALLSYTGTMKVIEKNATFGDLQKVEFKLSNSNLSTKDFFEKFRIMQMEIDRLKQ